MLERESCSVVQSEWILIVWFPGMNVWISSDGD